MDEPSTHTGTLPPGIFSVGHSNVTLSAFVDLLRAHGIEVVADVRSCPRSKFVPHFDAQPLQRSLGEAGIRYVYLGKELGGRPDGDDYYDDAGHVLYGRVARSSLFLAGVGRLVHGAAQFRVTLLCSEEDPASCHRRLLISRVLGTRGIDVGHIRHDGALQPESGLASAEKPADPVRPPLFASPAEEEQAWRSSRSVSRRRAQRSSSGP